MRGTEIMSVLSRAAVEAKPVQTGSNPGGCKPSSQWPAPQRLAVAPSGGHKTISSVGDLTSIKNVA